MSPGEQAGPQAPGSSEPMCGCVDPGARYRERMWTLVYRSVPETVQRPMPKPGSCQVRTHLTPTILAKLWL
jgi:hypothetical protein